MRIQNLGSGKHDEFVDGIDIVWTAPEEGKDPRVVVGWYRGARLYRHRQHFKGGNPSAQHYKDKIRSFRAGTLAENAFVLPPEDRHLRLRRGKGWSGQASWWYANDTTDRSARAFVKRVKAFIEGEPVAPVGASPDHDGGRGRPAGAAASDVYKRYVRKYEINVHPQHDNLHKQFVRFSASDIRGLIFPLVFATTFGLRLTQCRK
nr:hypothetical protein [Mesorhizobium sp. LNHC220B00]